MLILGTMPHRFDIYTLESGVTSDGFDVSAYPDEPVARLIPGRLYSVKKTATVDNVAPVDKNTYSCILDARRLSDVIIEVYRTRLVLEKRMEGGKRINWNQPFTRRSFIVVSVHSEYGMNQALEHYSLILAQETENAS